MSDVIHVERDGPVLLIRINRQEQRNAINKATADKLRSAWQQFDADDSLRVGVLTGGDEVFCAGADLSDVPALSEDTLGENGPLGFTRLRVGKPTIAAAAGYAVAGGLELACWCDLRIADETAVFGCFERRFGVPLIDGGTQRLPRIVGLGRALEMILTGRPVDASEAKAIGLVNEVVPTGTHIQRAVELGKQLARFPQNCMCNDRLAVYDGLGRSLEDGLRIEAQHGQQTIASGEPTQGAERFSQGVGRKGDFSTS
ncbi:MAG: crotonase/enoyl-CoA hydratase family protein [Chloroflexota bacterium]